MPVGTVRIRGLRETQRAFRRMSGGLDKELRVALREAAWPIARDIRERERKWAGASTGTIGPRVTLAGAAVTQRAKKVDGKHPQFGKVQMLEAFLPALDDHVDDVELAAEHVLDVIEGIGGF